MAQKYTRALNEDPAVTGASLVVTTKISTNESFKTTVDNLSNSFVDVTASGKLTTDTVEYNGEFNISNGASNVFNIDSAGSIAMPLSSGIIAHKLIPQIVDADQTVIIDNYSQVGFDPQNEFDLSSGSFTGKVPEGYYSVTANVRVTPYPQTAWKDSTIKLYIGTGTSATPGVPAFPDPLLFITSPVYVPLVASVEQTAIVELSAPNKLGIAIWIRVISSPIPPKMDINIENASLSITRVR